MSEVEDCRECGVCGVWTPMSILRRGYCVGCLEGIRRELTARRPAECVWFRLCDDGGWSSSREAKPAYVPLSRAVIIEAGRRSRR